MTWTFKRGEQALCLETWFDEGRQEFVLAWRYSDGREDIERYTDRFTFRGRLLALEDQLRAWGWAESHPTGFVRDAWRVN